MGHGLVRKQVELLKNHAQVAPDEIDIVLTAHDVLALHRDLALVDFFQAVDGTQQGGLARTGRADDHHPLAGGDIQAHVLQGGQMAEIFPDVTDSDDGVVIVTFRHSSPAWILNGDSTRLRIMIFFLKIK